MRTRREIIDATEELLAEIGYTPADITYLALSHNHYDHSANANMFALSTWLVQKPERAAMFPDAPYIAHDDAKTNRRTPASRATLASESVPSRLMS